MFIKCNSLSKASYVSYNQINNSIICSIDSFQVDVMTTFLDFIEVAKTIIITLECLQINLHDIQWLKSIFNYNISTFNRLDSFTKLIKIMMEMI